MPDKVPENPVLQTGVQVVPLVAGNAQAPTSALATEGAVVHGVPPVIPQAPVCVQVPVVHVANSVNCQKHCRYLKEFLQSSCYTREYT